MPIWIRYKNYLMLCDAFSTGKSRIDGTHSLYAYPSGRGEDGPYIRVPKLPEQQANDLMRNIAEVVASGKTYFEIKE